MSTHVPLAILVVLTLAPEFAGACAVCTGFGEESRSAFIATTVLMTVLPLGMVGGVVWWLWRRLKAAEARELTSGGAGRSTPPPPRSSL